MATVQCCKCKQEQEAISGPTYGGAVGVEIKRRVCNDCWQSWLNGFGVKVINEMQLNMRNPEHVAMLIQQMRMFLTMPPEEG
ncbi:MAG: Fe(2+)-trafficking protein [Nitrospirota bacterium]|nr:Fe(2+)-trafficking protein [Nitrospirota bacterium]